MLVGVKTIVSSSIQVPPRPFAASDSLIGAPPVTETFFNWPSAKNAIHWPSGEKNGLAAPSVPASAVACNWSSFRMNSRGWPGCCATNASVVPSGDRIADAPRSVWERRVGADAGEQRARRGHGCGRHGAHSEERSDERGAEEGRRQPTAARGTSRDRGRRSSEAPGRVDARPRCRAPPRSPAAPSRRRCQRVASGRARGNAATVAAAARRVPAGSAAQSISCVSTAARTSEMSRPRTRVGRSASRRARRRMPRCRRGDRPPCRAPAPGAM